ncbi:MAG: ATP-binding protein [Armatimonadetes bacterium]|nr:ATP-binding protein [Armatimonadota bacterium]
MIEQPEVVVEVGPDVLMSSAKCDALQALEELIWNSLDADSTRVQISFIRNELESVTTLIVKDNGSGFEDKAKGIFGAFGDSRKKLRSETVGGRIQHGKEGKGRYKALSLGAIAEWVSIANEFDGSQRKCSITVTESSPNKFRPVEELTKTTDATGVTVSIRDANDEATKLADSNLVDELALRFAPYLFAYPMVQIWVEDERVDPEKYLVERHETKLHASALDTSWDANLLVCIWKFGDREGNPLKRFYFCTGEGFAVEDYPSYVQRLGISFTAYIRSAFFDFQSSTGYSGMGLSDPVARQLLDAARETVTEINRNRLAESARTFIDDLKTQDLYPFQMDAQGVAEELERKVFAVAAEQLFTLDPSIAKLPAKERKRQMKALQLAISSNEETIQFILQEVMDLNETTRRELFTLLKRVSLEKVISIVHTVVGRLDFLSALEQLLFSESKIKERKQLHPFLAQHIWLFGEQFHLATSDSSLKSVLIKHRSELGLEEPAFEEGADYSRLNIIPDLVLSKQVMLREGYFDHLVVELKAPGTLGEKEFAQIKKYARVVGGDPMFDKERTNWTFVLINNDVDEEMYKEACQRGRPRGLLIDQDNYQVWIKRWSEVIQDAKGRHEFLKKQLDLQIVNDQSGLTYLMESFRQWMPESIIERAEGRE